MAYTPNSSIMHGISTICRKTLSGRRVEAVCGCEWRARGVNAGSELRCLSCPLQPFTWIVRTALSQFVVPCVASLLRTFFPTPTAVFAPLSWHPSPPPPVLIRLEGVMKAHGVCAETFMEKPAAFLLVTLVLPSLLVPCGSAEYDTVHWLEAGFDESVRGRMQASWKCIRYTASADRLPVVENLS